MQPDQAMASRWPKLPLSWQFLGTFLEFSWFENLVSVNFVERAFICSANLDQASPELDGRSLGAQKNTGCWHGLDASLIFPGLTNHRPLRHFMYPPNWWNRPGFFWITRKTPKLSYKFTQRVVACLNHRKLLRHQSPFHLCKVFVTLAWGARPSLWIG